MQPRVILITGSTPPDACGVGDYTWQLASALNKAGVHAELLTHRQWNFGGTTRIIQKLLAEKTSLVHLQYPTMGYGYSLGPQAYALARPGIVTLHEFSLAHVLRKISLVPFTLRSPRIVLTSEFERQALIGKMPWSQGRTQVIPIGSNISPSPAMAHMHIGRIIYHGLIMPNKGLEGFLELSQLAVAMSMDWQFKVIGKVPVRHSAYASDLIASSRTSRVQWVLDRSSEEVAQILSEGGIAYLPFPDGASERRGSLKAILAFGLPCITRRTEMTPDDMAGAVAFADTPQQALEQVLLLMNSSKERLRLSQAALLYASQFTWEAIADRHLQMYREVMQ